MSKKRKAQNVADMTDTSTLEAALKRRRKAEGVPEPGPSKPPPPNQWSHDSCDLLQKKANLTDRQMRVVAAHKR